MADEVLVARELVRRVISGGLQRLASERERKTVAWPTGDEFTAERGQQAIADTVKVCVYIYIHVIYTVR